MIEAKDCTFTKHKLEAREDRAYGLCPICAGDEIQALKEELAGLREAARIVANELARQFEIISRLRDANSRLAAALGKEYDKEVNRMNNRTKQIEAVAHVILDTAGKPRTELKSDDFAAAVIISSKILDAIEAVNAKADKDA